jgi:hypothetical protein
MSEEKKRVNPVPLDTLALLDMTDSLERIDHRLAEATPRGDVPQYNLTLDTEWTSIDFLSDFGRKATGFTLFNDGASDVYFRINDTYLQMTPNPTPIKKNEKLDIDMKRSSIKRLYLKSTGSANVRLFVVI